MTIETKIAKNGKQLYYRVDIRGKKTRLTGVEGIFALAQQKSANQEALKAEIDAIDEYVISTDAQEVATDAEISAATAIKAHESSFWRVLATVKECRSYAEFCTGEAQWADRMVEDVDTRITEYPNDESLKEVRGEYLAEADNYRAQAQIALTQADTLETALANDSTLTAAQQSIISTATTNEQEENTMTTRDRYLAAKEVASVRHNFDNDRDEWYINGKRTNKKNAADTLKSYGLTLDTFKTEHEAYINEQIAEGARQMAIDDQAEHVGDKVAREVTACDDNDNVFALLPELDELNDVDEPEIVVTQVQIGDDIITYEDGKCAGVQSLKYGGIIEFDNDETRWLTNPKRDNGGFYFDDIDRWDEEDFFAEMMDRGACTIDELNQSPIDTDKPVDDFGAKLAELQAKRDAAQATLLKAQEEHEAAENTLQKFLSDTAGNLATKLQSLELDYSIKLVTKNGYSWTVTDFSNIYVDAFDGGKIFAFTDWRSRKYARYDTPAQVDKVIDMLRAVIERGDTKFKFPTVEELTTTRKAA